MLAVLYVSLFLGVFRAPNDMVPAVKVYCRCQVHPMSLCAQATGAK